MNKDDRNFLIKYRNRLEHRYDRFKNIVEEYENNIDSLSHHGYRGLGYYEGLLFEIDLEMGLLDDLINNGDNSNE